MKKATRWLSLALVNVIVLSLVLAGMPALSLVPSTPAYAADSGPNPLAWDIEWGEALTTDWPASFSPDGQGNLYVVLRSEDWQEKVACNLVKFDGKGIELWRKSLDDSAGRYSIAADKSGNVYVAGEPRATGHITLWKFDPAGNLLWTRVRASTAWGHRVAVDPKGEAVYLTSHISLGSATNVAAVLSRYNSNGDNPWDRLIDSNGDDSVVAVAAGRNEIYVAGATNGSFPGYTSSAIGFMSSMQPDGFLARVKPDGTVDWIKQQQSIRFTDLAVDTAGRAYTTQSVLDGLGVRGDTSAARFEKDSKIFKVIPLRFWPTIHSSIAVDAMGTIYVSGAYFDTLEMVPDLLIEKYDPAGNLTDMKTIYHGLGPWSVRVGGLGDIYTAYIADGVNYYDQQARIVKYEGDLIDTDGDGLPDKWEKNGVRVEGGFVDLPKMGADPLRKDIFVEIDWMSGAAQEPKPGALAIVMDAFRNAPVANPDGSTGINLHVDAGPASVMNPNTGETWQGLSKSNVVPWVEKLGSTAFLGGAYQWVDFDKIKNGSAGRPGNFDKSRQPIFHYSLFAYKLGDLGSASGISKGTGNSAGSDFIVSLGGWNGGTGGDIRQQAGTFMHELGHDLGLDHGGQDADNNKPNYLSIMNYSFQFSGLVRLDSTGNFVNGHFDYSRFGNIRALDESRLDEVAGITSADPTVASFSTIYYWVDPYVPGGVASGTSTGTRNIDWNMDGAISTATVSTSINKNNVLEVLESYEDWNFLIYKGGSIGKLGSAEDLPQETPVDELTEEEAAELVYPYAVGVMAPNNAGIKPGGSSVTYNFTVVNKGDNADTYTIQATSSAGWADLSGFPRSVSLTPAQSASISISVTLPASPTAAKDELTLAATSQTNARIWDSGKVVTVFQAASIGIEQQLTADTYGRNIYGIAIDDDWIAWAERQTTSGSPMVYYARNLVTGEQRQLRSVSLSYAPGYSPIDIHGSKVVYEAGRTINVYDLSAGTERTITPSTGLQGYHPRIYGDRVVYSSGVNAYLYDLATGNERQISNYAGSTSAGSPDIYGDRIVWLTKWNTSYYDINVFDLSSNTTRAITTNASGATEKHAQIHGDRIVWEDNRAGTWNVYVYDLASNTESRVNSYTDPFSYSSYEHWPAISGDSIVTKRTQQDTPSTQRNDIYLHDLKSGTESMAVSRVSWPLYSTALAFDNGKIGYTKGNPPNLYMTALKLAPETSLSTSPAAPGPSGWFTTTPQVTLTLDTAGASTFYQWDSNANLGWTGYTGAFEAPEGEHMLYYYSADDLGNTESVKSKVFKVDITSPVTTISTTPSPGEVIGGVFKVVPQVTLNTGEAGSTTYYQWDTTSWTWNSYAGTFAGPEGEHTLYYYSVDSRGSAEKIQSQTFKVDLSPDTVAPVTTISIDPVLEEGKNVYPSSPVITLSVVGPAVTFYSWDAPMNGIPARVEMFDMLVYDTYSPNIGSPTLYWGKFPAPEGTHTLYFFSVDPSGNIEGVQSRVFTVGIAETTSLTITADNKTKVYGQANPVLTVQVAGLTDGDTLESLNLGYSLSTTADVNSPVGSYPITVSGGLTSTEKYDPIVYASGTLTVTPAPLTVRAVDETRLFGAPNPPLTAEATGLVGNDTLESLGLGYTLSTAANITSLPGIYPITFSGGLTSSANYSPVEYLDGTLTVLGVPVAVAAASSLNVETGQPVQFDGSRSYHQDPHRAITRFEWDFDYDGTAGFVPDAEGAITTHSFGSAGTHLVALRVTDDNVPPETAIATVTVAVYSLNQPPVADPGGPYEMTAGDVLTLDGSASSDPNAASGDYIAAYQWDLNGDGAFDLSGAMSSAPWETLQGLGISDPGVYAITLGVTDSYGLVSSASTTLTVSSASPPAAYNLAITIMGNGGVTRSPDQGIYHYGDVVTLVPTPATGWTFSGWSTNVNASNQVTINGNTTVTATFAENANSAPVIVAISTPADPLAVGVPIVVSATFTDANTADTHSAAWDWGDGSASAGTVTESGGLGSVSGTHTYTSPGIYSIALTVTDNHGASDQEKSTSYIVVYDPDGGFVTGGGWIDSPAGAYAADETLTGKATFGFVSKYAKGATAPTGNTVFQFHVADLTFKSISYEWLVISGARAQFKGEGTINGSGSYGFLLTAIDGSLAGGGGTDKFRIKIWDKAADVIVYDNQIGESDSSDKATVLGSGSIVIHRTDKNSKN